MRAHIAQHSDTHTVQYVLFLRSFLSLISLDLFHSDCLSDWGAHYKYPTFSSTIINENTLASNLIVAYVPWLVVDRPINDLLCAIVSNFKLIFLITSKTRVVCARSARQDQTLNENKCL